MSYSIGRPAGSSPQVTQISGVAAVQQLDQIVLKSWRLCLLKGVE
jgi:hypothetical protein